MGARANYFWAGGDGGTVLVFPTALLTQYTCIYNFVRDFIMAFFKDFSVPGGGRHFLCEIIY